MQAWKYCCLNLPFVWSTGTHEEDSNSKQVHLAQQLFQAAEQSEDNKIILLGPRSCQVLYNAALAGMSRLIPVKHRSSWNSLLVCAIQSAAFRLPGQTSEHWTGAIG